MEFLQQACYFLALASLLMLVQAEKHRAEIANAPVCTRGVFDMVVSE